MRIAAGVVDRIRRETVGFEEEEEGHDTEAGGEADHNDDHGDVHEGQDDHELESHYARYCRCMNSTQVK